MIDRRSLFGALAALPLLSRLAPAPRVRYFGAKVRVPGEVVWADCRYDEAVIRGGDVCCDKFDMPLLPHQDVAKMIDECRAKMEAAYGVRPGNTVTIGHGCDYPTIADWLRETT